MWNWQAHIPLGNSDLYAKSDSALSKQKRITRAKFATPLQKRFVHARFCLPVPMLAAKKVHLRGLTRQPNPGRTQWQTDF